MIGGSDMHQHRSYGAPERPLEPGRIGFPTTWVQVDGELTPEAILGAVRAGRTFVSESPSGPQLFDLSTDDASGQKIFKSISQEDIQQGLDTAAKIGDFFTGFDYPPEPAPVTKPTPGGFYSTACLGA